MCKVPAVNPNEPVKGLFPDALYYGLGGTAMFSLVLGLDDYFLVGMQHFWNVQGAVWAGGIGAISILRFFDIIIQRIPE